MNMRFAKQIFDVVLQNDLFIYNCVGKRTIIIQTFWEVP